MASIEERFWKRVKKTDNCWLWEGADRGNGYGVLNVGGKLKSTHHVTWFLVHGEWPPSDRSWIICHTCDVRNCVNPDHLFKGSMKDNYHDMRTKGRAYIHPAGWKSPLSRWTEEGYQKLIELHDQGYSQRALANLLGCSRKAVRTALNFYDPSITK